jgi:hypothetical protein
MASAQKSVTLAPEQIRQIEEALSSFQHNVNNKLSLIAAATEVIRRRPEMSGRMIGSIEEQPAKILKEVGVFCGLLENLLQIESRELSAPGEIG